MYIYLFIEVSWEGFICSTAAWNRVRPTQMKWFYQRWSKTCMFNNGAQQQVCIAYEQTQDKPNPPRVWRTWPWSIFTTLYFPARQVIVIASDLGLCGCASCYIGNVSWILQTSFVRWLESVVYKNGVFCFVCLFFNCKRQRKKQSNISRVSPTHTAKGNISKATQIGHHLHTYC